MQEGEVDGLAMNEKAKTIANALRECANEIICADCNMTRCDNECTLIAAAFLIESLSAQLDQVTRERDSAVEDLSGYCGVCIYKTLPNAYEFCRNCKHSNRHYFTNEPALNNWQWRGVEVEGC